MKTHISRYLFLAIAVIFVHSAYAQTTANVNFNVSGTSTLGGVATGSAAGNGSVSPVGNAAVSMSSTQAVDANFNPTGPIQATITFSFNRLDSFSVTASVPNVNNATVATFPGTISGGTGAYNGASGSGTFTITVVSSSQNGLSVLVTMTLTGTGNIKVGQTTTAITVANVSLALRLTPVATISVNGTGTVTPGGNVTMSATINTTDGVAAQGTATFSLNANDSLTVFFSIANLGLDSYTFPATVTGGTGVFAGATGSATMTIVNTTKSAFTLTGSGSVTVPAQGTVRPTITSVKTSGSDAAFIAPNTWVEIQGNNLVPASTPAAGVIWSNAPEFASNRMPTQLGGISVTVNGKPAYIYFVCRAGMIPYCGNNKPDQINILTPLDTTVGQVLVVVTNGNVSSTPFVVSMRAASPSFLQWDLTGHPVATHADFTLLGPASLFPGSSTPAKKLETILVYGDGFGLPTATLVEGSASQTGVLPNPQPVCTFGTTPVTATVVLVSPGLYGFGLVVPNTAVSGDNPITCTYGNAATPAGDVINVQ